MFKNDLIVRKDYLDLLKPFIDFKMIKIFAGVRRSGKSYLLDMVGDELLSRGVNLDHIVYRLYTSVEVNDGLDKTTMFKELKELIRR